MVLLNILFAILAAKWVIDSEIYTFAWFAGGVCLVLNTLSVLQYFF